MRFVPIKSSEQQAAGMGLKTRELLVRQRSQSANTMRAHMAEMGIIACSGITSIAKLICMLRNDDEARIAEVARSSSAEYRNRGISSYGHC